ncbi:hypothetical protein HS7_18550 [Sulfolobales archaeon HS-7]|nr:hypothetical protein HS7_18550 [Sulfolobales archaeon HS-7]
MDTRVIIFECLKKRPMYFDEIKECALKIDPRVNLLDLREKLADLVREKTVVKNVNYTTKKFIFELNAPY